MIEKVWKIHQDTMNFCANEDGRPGGYSVSFQICGLIFTTVVRVSVISPEN